MRKRAATAASRVLAPQLRDEFEDQAGPIKILFRQPASARPPVLLVPGSFSGAWIWRGNFLEYFHQAGYEVAAMSFGGHGQRGWSLWRRGLKAFERDLEAAIAAAVGSGVDAVFDPLGADSFPRSLHALKPGGMLVAYGFMNEVLGRGGSIPMDFVKLKLWDWLPNGHATAFYSIGAMRRNHPEWFKQDLATLFAMLADQRFDPAVAEVVPLTEVRRAHERVEAGEVQGKLVMRVTEA